MFGTFQAGRDLDLRLRSPDRDTVLAALDEVESVPHPALKSTVEWLMRGPDQEIGERAELVWYEVSLVGNRPARWPIDLGTDGSPESIVAAFDAVWEEVRGELVEHDPASSPQSIEQIEATVRAKYAPEPIELPLDYRRYLDKSTQHGWVSRDGLFHLLGGGVILDGYRPGIVVAWWYDDHFVFLDPREEERSRPIKYYDIDEDEEPDTEYASFSLWLLTEMRRRR